MSTGDLLDILPTELKFPFEFKKQSSCSLQLTNKTDQYVAFKVKTTNPKRYCVRPNTDIVLPGATCNVKVTMQAQKEAPPDMQCKDKFLLQSVIASPGATVKNITPEMFNKEVGKLVDEFKLRVVYFPANLPSPVPEGSEEGPSPQASLVDNGHAIASSFDSASSLVYKLTEEKKSAFEQNRRLHQELDCWHVSWYFMCQEGCSCMQPYRCTRRLFPVTRTSDLLKGSNSYCCAKELMRREVSKRRSGGFSFIFIMLIGLLGILVGYLIKKT